MTGRLELNDGWSLTVTDAGSIRLVKEWGEMDCPRLTLEMLQDGRNIVTPADWELLVAYITQHAVLA